ncbi:MAG: hypothetical protein IJS28_06085 [Synergistaceae bacterium]|nr:hypothetical protein [Synergistaceae bacterium]
MKKKSGFIDGKEGLLLSLAVTALLVVFAGAACAASSTPNIADTYTIDGITYYNVNSQNFNSDKKFYVDVISAKHSALGGHSLGDLWLMAAAGMGKEYVPTGGLGNIHVGYIDILKQAILTGKLPDEYKYIYTYSYSAPQWSNYNGGYVETSATIKPFISTGLGNVKYTVRFSDFTVGALLPADAGLYVSSTTETGSVRNVEASSVKNDTDDTITASQHVSRNVAESLESSVSHSSSYSFTEGLKIGFETGVSAIAASFKLTGEISTEFSQAFEDGWTKSEARTKSYEKGSDVSVTLPPYTNVLIKQGETDTTTTTRYNCPVIVGYKVTIYIQPDLFVRYLTFGSSNSNARKDLNHRAFDEGKKSLDEQAVDWETILADNDFKDAITKITQNVPMSGSGATTVYTNKTTYSEVAGKAAIYPLSSVKLGSSNVSFISENNTATMKVGNYSYTDFLTVKGYNAYDAEYYGFDKRKGRWAVVDANMREISASSAPVVLESDNVTGLTKFRAVKPGTCYLRYFIDENVYPTGIGANTFTKNSELAGNAMLTITVLEDEVTYEIFGSYTGRVNSVPESLEGEDKLEVSVYDSTGKEIEGSYVWDQKEIKGITLTPEGLVSFTKPKKYHVRVMNASGTIYSDWAEIEAEVLGDDSGRGSTEDEEIQRSGVADEDTVIVVSGSYTGGVSNDEESIDGAGKLEVAMYDSTGKEESFTYSWEKQDGSEGMTLDESGNVSFTRTGSYYVRARSGQVYSDWVEINANEKAPARFVKVPTATRRTYDGTASPLMNEDGEYTGGVSIVYALGSDGITAPSEYSSEIPMGTQAGTYYVWCKVMGDESHDNSEPVCVAAAIGEMGGGEGSSSGSSSGCDAGVSVLGLLGAALIFRRKAR